MPKKNKKKKDKHNPIPNHQANAGNDNSDQTTDNRFKTTSFFDGIGRPKQVFNTDNQYIARQYVQFHAYFYTQIGEYDAYYTLGRSDNSTFAVTTTEQEFTQDLISFDTTNDMQQDLPTLTLTLLGSREWDEVLVTDDYVVLRVSISYPDGKYKDIPETTLMAGLISNIQYKESPTMGNTYVITCSGISKVLSNINLGLPKTVSTNGGILFFDIEGNSNPANEDFTTGSSGSTDDADIDSGDNAKDIWNYFHNKGFDDKHCAGILGNAFGESQLNPTIGQVGGGGGLGIFQATPGSKMTDWCKSHNKDWKKPTSQCAWFYDAENVAFSQYKSSSGSVDKLTQTFFSLAERGDPAQARMSVRTAAADKYMKQFGK